MSRNTPRCDEALSRLGAEILSTLPQDPHALATQMEGWRDDALCAQIGAEFFFPEKNDSARDAKRICGMCAVKAACLLDALSKGDDYDGTATQQGIYAGIVDRKRAHLRKMWGLPATGSRRSEVIAAAREVWNP